MSCLSSHLLLLHLVDHHAAELLLRVVVAQLLLVQWSAREQVILVWGLACKILNENLFIDYEKM